MSFESRRADGLKRAKAIAEKHGGFLVSKEYINNQQKLEWKCANENHPTFFIKYNKVSCCGQWCPECKNEEKEIKKSETAKRQEAKLKIRMNKFILNEKKTISLQERRLLSFNKINQIASNLNATVVTEEYLNQYQKIELSCNSGNNHPNWSVLAFTLMSKKHKGCQICHPPKYKMHSFKEKISSSVLRTDALEIVRKKKGEIVSFLPKGRGIFSCLIEGHNNWETRIKSIVSGVWCKSCNFDKVRLGNKKLLASCATLKGGFCLNPEDYLNNHTKLRWKCGDENHKPWNATFHSIKILDTWCPECSTNHKSEGRTRAILEYLLGCKLEKSYPIWLKNDLTGKNMELDGFNEKSRIAFEFQGEQHYKLGFHCDEDMLKQIQYRDALKRKLCDEREITLIVIDQNHKTKRCNGLFNEIIKSLQEKNVPYRSDVDEKKIEEIFYSY